MEVTTVAGARCRLTGAYAFDRAVTPDEAGPEPATIIGQRSDLMQSMRDLRKVQAGRGEGQTDSRLSHAYLPSLHPHPPQRIGETRAEGAAGLMLQELLESTLWRHLSSTSIVEAQSTNPALDR